MCIVAYNNRISIFPGLPVFFLSLILFSSFNWGFLYPDIFRLPMYFLISLFFVLTRLKIDKSFTIRPWLTFLFLYTVLVSMDKVYSTIYIVLVSVFTLQLSKSINDAVLSQLTVSSLTNTIAFTVLFSILALILLSYNSDKQFPAGFFPEPSHFGLTLGPLMAYLIFTTKYRYFGLVAVALAAIYSPSSTFFLSLTVFSIFWKFRKINSANFIILYYSLLGAALLILACIGLLPQLDAYMKSESYLIWNYGFLRAFDVILDNNYFGVGPFGWVSSGESDATSMAIELMNQRDLASLIPFGFASYGIAFPVIFVVFNAFLLKYKRSDEIDTLLSILMLTYIFIFCFRWVGLTLSPILVLFAFVIACRRRNALDVNIQNFCS